MQLFSRRSNVQKKSSNKHHQAGTPAKPKKHKNGKCRALCCGASRLSVSSSASCSSLDAPEPTPPPGLSNIAHGMVQARLQSMIDDGRLSARRAERGLCACACRKSGCDRACIVLVAVDKRTYDPREDFRRSIAEVITAKRMAEPAELRALLNCYVSVNAREHRAAILAAFYEVCSGLFSRKC